MLRVSHGTAAWASDVPHSPLETEMKVARRSALLRS
jgi:hypothetical protein